MSAPAPVPGPAPAPAPVDHLQNIKLFLQSCSDGATQCDSDDSFAKFMQRAGFITATGTCPTGTNVYNCPTGKSEDTPFLVCSPAGYNMGRDNTTTYSFYNKQADFKSCVEINGNSSTGGDVIVLKIICYIILGLFSLFICYLIYNNWQEIKLLFGL